MTGSRRTNGARVDALDPPSAAATAEGIPDDAGVVRPALTPAQLAFLALIAALIVTAIRRLRRSRQDRAGE